MDVIHDGAHDFAADYERKMTYKICLQYEDTFQYDRQYEVGYAATANKYLYF
jgi:hypothetical protein